MESSPAQLYIAEVLKTGRHLLSVVCKLLSLQVCPRCCLRFCSVQGSVYTERAPKPFDMFQAARKLWISLCSQHLQSEMAPSPPVVAKQNSSEHAGRQQIVDEGGVDAELGMTRQGDCAEAPEKHGGAGTSPSLSQASNARQIEALEALEALGVRDDFLCALCLGILQGLDAEPGPSAAEEYEKTLPTQRLDNSEWKRLPDGSFRSLQLLLDTCSRGYQNYKYEQHVLECNSFVHIE